MTDAYEIVEANWPYDGPHSDDSMVSAATAMDRLARYVANATQRPLSSGPALSRIASGLHAALSKVDQVLGQMADAASGEIADRASLYDDRHDRPGADTAAEASILLHQARHELRTATRFLGMADAAASHLGNEDTPEAVRRG